MRKIVLIKGDGIGPEVCDAAVRVIAATGVEIEWIDALLGIPAIKEYGTPLPDGTLDKVRETGIALKGPTSTPVGEGHASVNVALRKTLDLYANLRPVRGFDGIKSRFEGVDLVIVRENTEDLYSGLEHEVVPGVVESLKIITEKASTRIARFAFDYAASHGRKKITAIHKANIMKLSDGLFLKSVRAVAKKYPDLAYDEKIVDNASMQMVLNPSQFDVMLNENLYGDILSDLAAGLVGGLGLLPGANIGEDCAVFEAAHGSAPDIAGKDIANPTAVIMSGVMMLRHLGEIEAGDRIEGALRAFYRGPERTGDLGGKLGCSEFTKRIVSLVENG
ncbi:MAG: isocitrate/isopropylmalate dehydrogenase family protein [Acidobacteria bacterium]|nr:isocitrate/isopropylmalate dehydrogenase family protein [Acidobacteriota bacterium]